MRYINSSMNKVSEQNRSATLEDECCGVKLDFMVTCQLIQAAELLNSTLLHEHLLQEMGTSRHKTPHSARSSHDQGLAQHKTLAITMNSKESCRGLQANG